MSTLTIKGKTIYYYMKNEETPSIALNTIYALMGESKCPGSDIPIDPKLGFNGNVTLLEVYRLLENRFDIVSTAYRAGRLEQFYNNMNKIMLLPAQAAAFYKEAVGTSLEEYNKMIEEFNLEAISDMVDLFIGVSNDKHLNIFDKDRNLIRVLDPSISV